jgi:hypothetical protein
VSVACRTCAAAQHLVTSRRLHAGGFRAALNARLKTASVKPAARKTGANIATNQGGSTW